MHLWIKTLKQLKQQLKGKTKKDCKHFCNEPKQVEGPKCYKV